MPKAPLFALTLALFILGCATDLGTGLQVMEQLEEAYPITVGKLVAAHMDPSRRLRVYVSLCHENPDGAVCGREEPRVLAMVESGEKRLLERLAERYLIEGRDKPLYIYGPMCDGLEEMVVVPRCQSAIALGVWDPYLNDYIVYSTLHGDSVMESDGFATFLEVTGKAAGVVRKAAKFVP
jgi:hypothetical protein